MDGRAHGFRANCLSSSDALFAGTRRTLSAPNLSSSSRPEATRASEMSTWRARAKTRSRHRSGATGCQGRPRQHTANGFLHLLEEVTAALWQQELALRPKTLGWGTLRVTICVPAARGQRSEIKGDPSGVWTSGFFQVRDEIDFLDASTKGPR